MWEKRDCALYVEKTKALFSHRRSRPAPSFSHRSAKSRVSHDMTQMCYGHYKYALFHVYILREINLAISDKAGCISDLIIEWEII